MRTLLHLAIALSLSMLLAVSLLSAELIDGYQTVQSVTHRTAKWAAAEPFPHSIDGATCYNEEGYCDDEEDYNNKMEEEKEYIAQRLHLIEEFATAEAERSGLQPDDLEVEIWGARWCYGPPKVDHPGARGTPIGIHTLYTTELRNPLLRSWTLQVRYVGDEIMFNEGDCFYTGDLPAYIEEVPIYKHLDAIDKTGRLSQRVSLTFPRFRHWMRLSTTDYPRVSIQQSVGQVIFWSLGLLIPLFVAFWLLVCGVDNLCKHLLANASTSSASDIDLTR